MASWPPPESDWTEGLSEDHLNQLRADAGRIVGELRACGAELLDQLYQQARGELAALDSEIHQILTGSRQHARDEIHQIGFEGDTALARMSNKAVVKVRGVLENLAAWDPLTQQAYLQAQGHYQLPGDYVRALPAVVGSLGGLGSATAQAPFSPFVPSPVAPGLPAPVPVAQPPAPATRTLPPAIDYVEPGEQAPLGPPRGQPPTGYLPPDYGASGLGPLGRLPPDYVEPGERAPFGPPRGLQPPPVAGPPQPPVAGPQPPPQGPQPLPQPPQSTLPPKPVAGPPQPVDPSGFRSRPFTPQPAGSQGQCPPPTVVCPPAVGEPEPEPEDVPEIVGPPEPPEVTPPGDWRVPGRGEVRGCPAWPRNEWSQQFTAHERDPIESLGDEAGGKSPLLGREGSGALPISRAWIDLRSVLAQLGKDVQQGLHDSPEDLLSVRTLYHLAALTNDAPNTLHLSSVATFWRKWKKSKLASPILKKWREQVASLSLASTGTLDHLYAARAYLDALASILTELSSLSDNGDERARTDNWGVTLGVPLSGVHGQDLHWTPNQESAQATTAREISARVTLNVRAIFVPMIEAADVIIRWEQSQIWLSAEQTIEAYLAGELCHTDTEAYLGLNGLRRGTARGLIAGRRTRPGPVDLIHAYRRGLIDKEQFTRKMRGSGFLFRDEVNLAYQLTEQIPPVTDLIRFMVRDVADEAIAKKFGYDSEFEKKFQGQLPSWSKAQGLTEEVMRTYWRAHWRLPGMGQVYEMHHRLRSDHDDPEIRKIAFTKEDVDDVLATDDIPKPFRDRLIAISYRPLTRVDVRRAYRLGRLTGKQYVEAYRDLGYTKEKAEILLRFGKELRYQWLRRRAIIKHYVDGVTTWDEVERHLGRYRVTRQELGDLQREALLRIKARTSAACTRALKRRYLTGELDEGEARLALVQSGTDHSGATQILSGWKCEKDARGRAFNATTVCRLAERGLIGPEEVITRYVRLGYSERDAVLLSQDCARRLEDRRKADAARSDARWQRQQAARKKEREREEARRNRAATKAVRERDRISRAEARRKKRLAKAVLKLSKRTGDVESVVSKHLDETIGYLIQQFGFTEPEAESTVIEVINDTRVKNYSLLSFIAEETAEGLLELESHED